jgi:subtilisin family serine protease
MKSHLSRAILVLLLVWPAALHSGAFSQDDTTPQEAPPQEQTSLPSYRPGQILVKFRPQTPHGDRAQTLAAHELPVLEDLPDLQVLRVAAPQGQEQALVDVLNRDPRVEYAELDYMVHATIIPDDTSFGLQWSLPKINAPAAWDDTTGSPYVTIAIIDTGVDLNHPDLNDKIVPGWDFINDDAIAQDDHGHGTHVAGIAAAETNNDQGVAGVSWGARIMPIKVLDEHGDGLYSDVARGVRYGCNHGAQIINLSLGGSNSSSVLKEALEYAQENGCFIVAAAGNSGQNRVDCPARYPEAMAVAATDDSDQHAYFSDYGPEIEIAAPGVDIYSTLWAYPNNHTYGYKLGTSMSTPQVAGVAALLWSACPQLTSAEIRSVIQDTAKDLGATGWDPKYGYGRIDARKAVRAAGPPPTLAVSAEQMVFLADATAGPWPQTLQVRNDAACGTLDWSADAGEDWLETNPDEGQASFSQPAQIAVSVDEDGLSTGNTYNSTVTVDSDTLGILESPQLVNVRFVYSDTPLLRTFFPLGMGD